MPEKALDPRAKLMIVLSLSSLAVLIRNIYILVGILLVSVLLSIVFHSPILSIFKKFKRVLWIFVFLIFIQSLFHSHGTSIMNVGSITLITTEGMLKGIQLVLRMLIIISSATIMATNSSREVIQGLVQWKIPYEIAFMVSIAIRFLPTFTEEIKDVVTAIQLRGIELDKIPLKKRIKIYSYVLMPIVANSLIKARKLSTAMEMKGFGIYSKRTSYHLLKMQWTDYAVMFVTITTFTLIIGLNYF
ncbi:energy-coupling factor transporter transmembrane component T family protein [Clostridium formicaceticum]|nr:energy-coupling factor transporter transmembrane component T [Clostridium formicaceticum]AOY78330.1 cobalt transport protein [Clostridium formicaceticum]